VTGDPGALGPRVALRGVGPALRLAWRAAPWWLTAHVTATLVSALAPAASVWLLSVVLDALVAGARADLVPGVAGLVSASLVVAAAPSVTGFLRAEVGRAVGRRAQADLYLATARLPGLARLEDPAFRDQLRMASQAGRSSPGSVLDGVLGIGRGAVSISGLVLVLAAASPVVAGIVVLGLVPALVAEAVLARARTGMLWRISPLERREQFYAGLQTSLAAAKELRLFGLFDLFRGRMITELGRADRHRRRMDVRSLRVQLGLGLLSAAVLGGGLWWAVAAASRGELTVGEVSAFVAGVTGLQGALTGLVYQVSSGYQALLMYHHYREVLAAEPDLPVAADPRPVPPLRDAIEFRDVWFRYAPGQPWVLRGVDLRIPRGAAVALVGLNGAGKSTLFKLLCRFYDPQRGSIRWDGVDLRELSPRDLRERIGAVFQDFMSYDLTAAENIGVGDVEVIEERDRIRAAAEKAGVHDTLAALPEGYDTMLSREFTNPSGKKDTDGTLLSGGQWQRLALARTFLRDRRDLLLLDEPSSGLDAAAEHELHRRLRRHRAGATSVLVSHRLATVRDAATIVVLSAGRVVEQGTHGELLAEGGEYARLFTLQADGYQPAGRVSQAR
jgi:ATP-binding cassette, subfamily B, bacterial